MYFFVHIRIKKKDEIKIKELWKDERKREE